MITLETVYTQDPFHNIAKLDAICHKHEICENFKYKLKQLETFEIIIVIDDSGSMNTRAGSVNVNNPNQTRWEEAKKTSSIIIDIASIMDNNGVNIHFLNRSPLIGISSSEQLDLSFSIKPQGYTPIVPILKNIYKNPIKKGKSNRLVILLTDGQPTSNTGQINIQEFKSCLLNDRLPSDYLNIVACTDDDNVMSYLNNWDDTIPRLDVIDDYGSEYNEVIRAQGKNFPFSYGDYVVKSMLGSVDPYFDHLDEVNMATGIRVYRQSDCCNIL
jgi:hypothetical protein